MRTVRPEKSARLNSLDRTADVSYYCMMTQMSKQLPASASRRCCERVACCVEPALFRALGDPTRAALFVMLAGCREPCTVSCIAECCPIDLSVVSRHLAILRDAGLLSAERRGKEVLYRVRHRDVAAMLRRAADAIDEVETRT